MTMQQPTRRRRRNTQPGSTQSAGDSPRPAVRRHAPVAAIREHHVTTDYSYVRKDLLLVLAVTIICSAFIVGMSFVL